MQELAEGWKRRLENELKGFADRGVLPQVEREDTTLSAQWITRGKEKNELFALSQEGALRWIDGPHAEASYQDFLASESMADFKQLAEATVRSIDRLPRFVPNDALIETNLDAHASSATPERIAELASRGLQGAEGRTELFFLKGDPGAGKTSALHEATAAQAARYLAGETDFLFFYVSAQGRELSNLRDAFSGELQDLRAAFTRDAIPTLVRAGLLVPVIDGFDELLGTAGYSGAFSSLQNLLAELNGLGAIVVSARSAFYDLEFLGRSTSPANKADLSITTVTLQPWSDPQLHQYLGTKSDANARKLLDRLPEADRELLRRPFFASQFTRFAQAARESDTVPDLLEYLIGAYIEREAGKIVDSNGDPVLPAEGHRYLFEIAASEMWESEARQLSRGDLATVTELVAEDFGLRSDEATQLTAKVASYAGFRAGGTNGGDDFAFEHEVYFDYFLASAVQKLLTEGRIEELQFFLDRGIMPDSVIAAALKHAGGDIPELPPELLRCPVGVRHGNRRRNLGTLIAAYARENGPVSNTSVHNLEFMDLTFGRGSFVNVIFDNCLFYEVSLKGTQFTGCDATTSKLSAIDVDDHTQLEVRGLVPGRNFGSMRHPQEGDVYAPDEAETLLIRLGSPVQAATQADEFSYSDHATALVKLLQRAARAYRRTNILYEADEPRQLFKSEQWPELKRLLLEHGVVREETRDSAGPRVVALRLQVALDQLLTGQTATNPPPGPITDLWQALRRL